MDIEKFPVPYSHTFNMPASHPHRQSRGSASQNHQQKSSLSRKDRTRFNFNFAHVLIISILSFPPSPNSANVYRQYSIFCVLHIFLWHLIMWLGSWTVPEESKVSFVIGPAGYAWHENSLNPVKFELEVFPGGGRQEERKRAIFFFFRDEDRTLPY